MIPCAKMEFLKINRTNASARVARSPSCILKTISQYPNLNIKLKKNFMFELFFFK